MAEAEPSLDRVVSGWHDAAMPLTSTEPGGGVVDLRPLAALLGEAKVVGLGESAHGVGELFTMKHRLIEFLVTELGFTTIAFEASHAGSLAIDEYVRGGVGDPATALTGQGYTAWDTEEVGRLLTWLREHNATVDEPDRVAFWGLDSGYNARGRARVRRHLARTAGLQEATVEPAFSILERAEPQWPFQLTNPVSEAALLQAHAQLEELDRRLRHGPETATIQDDEATRVRRLVRMMRQWSGPERQDRSRQMGETLLDLIDHSPPGRRVVVWAHNWHIGRGSNAPGVNLGDVLTARYGSQYVSLALEFGRGSCHMRTVGPDLASAELCEYDAGEPPEGSLPWCLSATGHASLAVNLRDQTSSSSVGTPSIVTDWLSRPRIEHEIGWTSADWSTYDHQSLLAVKYDGIVFVGNAHPSHPTPNARAAIAAHERY